MHPKVSIVIPVFNGADYLDQAIHSALAQTYEKTEILVINDGSSDGGATERIAERFGNQIRYFSKPNGGVGSALNYAIREMSGEYFSWLSHDDLYAETKLEQEMERLSFVAEANRARTIIYSDYAVFSSDPAISTPVLLSGVPPEQFRLWLTMENALHGCTLIIPKAAFAECGVFDESLRTTQDYELWFRLAATYRFIHLPQVLVKARSHHEQGSVRMASTASAEINALLSRFVASLSEDELRHTGLTVAEAYATIAASMWRRGFRPAGATAARLAVQHLRVSSLRQTGKVAWIMARGLAYHYLFKVARFVLRPPVRLMIKSFFRSPERAESTAEPRSNYATLEQKFSEIYEKNIFGGRVSRSGEGSDLMQTAVIRRELPALLKSLEVRTFLDAPCGDWCWMKESDLGVEHYIGVDIVEALIEKNQRAYGNESTGFHCLNLTEDELPKADLIFSRDCFVHLSFKDALNVIANFKRSGSKYLLTTTFTERNRNNDLVGKDSFWRPLNMQLPPFSFPTPQRLINEGCTEERGQYPDKCLGLWRLDDLR